MLRWFDLAAGTERTIDHDGVVRAASFPGLWIHAEALFASNHAQLIATLETGLATTEHAQFVQRLAAAHQKQ